MVLKSAVARVFQPGCKVDSMLILEGAQGTGKSTAVRILSGDEHFSDNLPDISTKDAMTRLLGKGIVEVAELDQLFRADDATIKAFLSRHVDRFRPPYGRWEVDQPRQCIFIGTTNKEVYLKDETGGRRYWPVRTGFINLDAQRQDRDQIWAQATVLYYAERSWHISDSELYEEAERQQAGRYDADVWQDPVAEFLKETHETTITEVMRNGLLIDLPQIDRRAQNRVMKILSRLPWSRAGRAAGGRTLWVRRL